MDEQMPHKQIERRQNPQEWHLDKRVVVSIIGSVVALLGILLTQTLTLVRWGSSVQSSIDQQRQTNAVVAERLASLESNGKDAVRLGERVVRVETMLESVQRTVNRIDDSLDSPGRRSSKR